MSCWQEVIALRVPCSEIGMEDAWDFCEAREKEPLFNWRKYPHFEAALVAWPNYLDLVLWEKEPCDPCFIHEHRPLTEEEKQKYLPYFLKLFPGLRPEAVRYVHFAFYNGTEAPDLYDGDISEYEEDDFEEDDFEKEGGE